MRNCPICSDIQAEVFGIQRYSLEETSTLPVETEIVACKSCGFVFARSANSAADYQKHYAELTRYESSVNASGSGEYALDKKRIAELVDTLTEDLAIETSILDIGAAKGGVLLEFQRRGYHHLYGVDASKICVESIASNGIASCLGKLEDDYWSVDPRQFDLVILSHVLEHVFDVRAGLASARRRLAPFGTIYIEVPDASRYTVNGFPPYYFFDPEHINHFDLASLQLLAAREELTIIRWQSKQLDVGAGSNYPALGVWLAARRENTPPEVDIKTREKIQQYMDDSRSMLLNMPIMAELLELSTHQKPIVLWGAGSHAKRLLANSPLASANLVAIIDSDLGKQGKRLSGIEIYSAQEGLRKAKEINATIVVAIAVNADAVFAELKATAGNLSIMSI